MNLLLVLTVLSGPLPVAASLKGRQYMACAVDDCFRAVNLPSIGYGPNRIVDCRGYMTSTVVVDPILLTATTTTVSTTTVIPPCPVFPTETTPAGIYARQPQAADFREYGPPRGHRPPGNVHKAIVPSIATSTGPIPYYASGLCRPDQYSSACRCLGVTSGEVMSTGLTLKTTTTVTEIESSLAPCSTPASTSVIGLSYSDKTSTTTISLYDPRSSVTGTGTGTGAAGSYYPTSRPSSTPSNEDPSYSLPLLPPPYGNTSTSSRPSYSYTSPRPRYTNHTTSDYGGIPTSDSRGPNSGPTSSPTTLPPVNSALLPTGIYGNHTLPPATTLPSNNTTHTPGNSTLPPPDPTARPTNITLSPFPTSPHTNTTLPPFSTSPPTNSSLPPFPTSPPTNTTLPPPATNISSPAGPTDTPTCSGRGVRLCSNICTDTTTSTSHCGACNNACPDGYLCTNGVCTRPACDSTCGFSRLCGSPSANTTCACGADVTGAGVCYNRSFDCGANTPPRCDTNAHCEVGTVCVRSACCGAMGGRCVSTQGCGIRGAGFELGARVAFDGFGGDGEEGGDGRSMMLF